MATPIAFRSTRILLIHRSAAMSIADPLVTKQATKARTGLRYLDRVERPYNDEAAGDLMQVAWRAALLMRFCLAPTDSPMTSGAGIQERARLVEVDAKLRRTPDFPTSDRPVAMPRKTLRERLRRRAGGYMDRRPGGFRSFDMLKEAGFEQSLLGS